MAKKNNTNTANNVPEEKVETPSRVAEKKENINQLKEMYSDFRDTLAEIVGDSGDFAKKHKFLIIIGFLLYLWNRNRTYTIEGFVKNLEKKLGEENNDW